MFNCAQSSPKQSGGVKCLRLPLASAAIFALASLTCASASAAGLRLGVVAKAASPATISADLQHETGHTAAQLTAKPACAPSEPGHMHCMAQVMVVRSTGKPAYVLSTTATAPMHVTHATKPAVTAPNQTPTVAPAAGTAAFLQWAYDLSWLSANNGATDTIAIIDAYNDPNAASDMAVFRSQNGLPACAVGTCFNQYNQHGQQIDVAGAAGKAPASDPTGGWEVEESLDLDAASALCPLCKIVLVEASNTYGPNLATAASVAADTLNADQISMSFGGDQQAGSNPEVADTWTYPGIATLAAAGDSSYPGPGSSSDSSNTNEVGYPAAYPDVTAVGGTSLTKDATQMRGFDESTWAIQTCSDGSTCGTESGCDTSQQTPMYQQNNADLIDACAAIAAAADVTNAGGRAYNDISADADPDTGLNIYDTFGGSNGLSGWGVVGGTSLATPLTAAFEAVTGVSGAGSPAWAYSDAALLNDIVQGSNGNCPSSAFLICNASPGWDGPTGNGSIDGDVVSGAPGIGAQPTASGGATSASVTASINPNDGGTTTYYWQYGPTTSYGYQTAPADPLANGAAFDAVAGTMNALEPCTYHYRLVATNPAGTVYGYDNTVTATASSSIPVNNSSGPPAISGTPQVGQQLSAQAGTWSTPDCDSPSYQWEAANSPTASPSPIAGATGPTYVPTSAYEGQYITVDVRESTSAGTSNAVASAPVGPVAAAPITTTTSTSPTTTTTTPTPPATMLVAPAVGGAATVGGTLTVTPGTYTNASAVTVRFYRCAHTCQLLRPASAYRYRIARADEGRYIKIVVTAQGATGTAPIVTTRWVGPVRAPDAGVVTIGSGAKVAAVATIKGTRQATLAHVLVVERPHHKLELSITRVGRAKTSVWAFVVNRGAVVSCSVSRVVNGHLTLALPTLKRGQSLRLVSVRA